MCTVMSKWEVAMSLLLRAHVRVFQSNQWLSLQCKICLTINNIYLGKSESSFDVYVNMVFVLTLTIQFNIWIFFLREFFTYMWLEIWDNVYTPNASLSWFAFFGMRAYEGAPLLSCSHLVDHTNIPLISHVNLIGQSPF